MRLPIRELFRCPVISIGMTCYIRGLSSKWLPGVRQRDELGVLRGNNEQEGIGTNTRGDTVPVSLYSIYDINYLRSSRATKSH